MKIVGWMQNKINSRYGSKNSNSVSVHHHTSRNEEFSDWPHGLLAIGTFGNTNDIKQEKEDPKPKSIKEFTLEEVVEKVQKELNNLLLQRQQDPANLFSGNPSLEDESNNEEADSHHLHGSSTIVVGAGKGMCLDNNTSKNINKKSLSFLLKKMFVCRGGFTPTPSLRDQVPESTLEKMLRAILHKKIYPQNPNSKKFLATEQKPSCGSKNEKNDKEDKGSKWVKTDSEYIVLEI